MTDSRRTLTSITKTTCFAVILSLAMLSLASCGYLRSLQEALPYFEGEAGKNSQSSTTSGANSEANTVTAPIQSPVQCGDTVTAGRWTIDLAVLSSPYREGSEIMGLWRCPATVQERACYAALHMNGSLSIWTGTGSGLKGYSFTSLADSVRSVSELGEDGSLVIDNGKEVVLLCVSDPAKNLRLSDLQTRATALAFGPREGEVLLGGADGRVYLWHLAPPPDGLSLERYAGPASAVNSVLPHPSGKAFFSADWQGGLSAWLRYSEEYIPPHLEQLFGARFQAKKSIRQKVSAAADDGIEKVVMDPSSEYLYAVTQKGFLYKWQIRGFKSVASIEAHKGLIYDLALSPTGRIATAGRDGLIRIWETVAKEAVPGENPKHLLIKLSEHEASELAKILFVSDQKIVAATASGKVVEVDVGGS